MIIILILLYYSLNYNCLYDDAAPLLIEAIQTFKNLEKLSWVIIIISKFNVQYHILELNVGKDCHLHKLHGCTTAVYIVHVGMPYCAPDSFNIINNSFFLNSDLKAIFLQQSELIK